MTLVVALRGPDHIVVAADRLAHIRDDAGMYRHKCAKLRTINKGRWVVGMSGAEAGLGLLDVLEARPPQSFEGHPEESMHVYVDAMWREYEKRHFDEDMFFVVAGVQGECPFMCEWAFREPAGLPRSPWGPTTIYADRCALGACRHGALYFTSEHHNAEMTVGQRVALAHFAISEAAKHDDRVERPVDVAIADKDGVVLLAERDIPEIVEESRTRSAAIRDIFGKNISIAPEVLAASRCDRPGRLPSRE